MNGDTISLETTPLQTPLGVRPLHELEIRMIILKFQGLSYAEISEHVGLSIHTVKSSFRIGERVYGAYWRYAREMAHQLGKESLISLQKQMKTAVEVIDTAMTDPSIPPALRLKAAMYVIDKVTPVVKSEEEYRGRLPERILEVKSRLRIGSDDFDNYAQQIERAENSL